MAGSPERLTSWVTGSQASRHVPLGVRAGGFPCPLGRGAANRREAGTPTEAVGISCTARPRRGMRSFGAGDGLCVLLCASSRRFRKDGPWGFYCFRVKARASCGSAVEATSRSRTQQLCAAHRSPERSERQTAVDGSRCSRLTSRRSPVRAGHRPSSRGRFRSGTSTIASADDMSRNRAVGALWKRGD